MTIHEKQYGVDLEGPRNPGVNVHISAVEFILNVFEPQFPVHEEARVLRTGPGFFKFMARRTKGRRNGSVDSMIC